MEEQIKTLENRLTTMVLENNGHLKRIKALERENEYLSIRLNSVSFRIGEIIVNGLARPGKNTLMMPFRIIGLAWELFKVKRF